MPTPALSDTPQLLPRWLWVALFAVAFAWVEGAVVVYLREIYFDGGFAFPLKVVWEGGRHVADPLVGVELVREIATLLMLAAVGGLAGRSGFDKFCFFMVAFGVWDIFYYVWLYVMSGWPTGLMTWDLLFFVPLPWVGPVITPLLIALALTAAGTTILAYEARGIVIRWRWYDLAIELGCALLLVVAFCWDWKNIIQLPGPVPRSGVPNPFAWWLYLPTLFFAAVYFLVRLAQMVGADRRRAPRHGRI